MKSISTYSLTLLVVFLLGLCSLNMQSVSAKTLVRGDHRPKTLKRFSMHSRQLMHDKEEYEETEEPTEEETEEPTDEPTKAPKEKDDEEEEEEDDEEEETEDPQEAAEATEAPTVIDIDVVEAAVEGDVTNMTEPETMPEDDSNVADAPEEIAEDTVFSIPLEPFSLTIDGSVSQDDLNLEEYLLDYMKQFMANLIAVDLDVSVLEEEEEETEAPMDNTTRALRAYSVARFLQAQTFYAEGTATFQGPPMRGADEVDAALSAALQDTTALQDHLVTSSPGSNATVTGTNPRDPKPDGIQTEESTADEFGEDTPLGTTGLVIVIIAACVGGLALIIIMMVGLSGPSGVAGGKQGLPEQPRN